MFVSWGAGKSSPELQLNNNHLQLLSKYENIWSISGSLKILFFAGIKNQHIKPVLPRGWLVEQAQLTKNSQHRGAENYY